jgi:carboxyl-terminal processing protease
MKILMSATTILLFWLGSSSAFALNCQQVKQLTALYLKYHYSYDNFDDELSKRVVTTFVKNWDPGKLYFFKQDVDSFTQKYGNQMDDLVRKGDCAAISDVVNIYAQRFEERSKHINTLIDAKYDFTIDENLNLDRKNTEYASTKEELDERWRQRIKFQYLQLKTSVPDWEKAKEKMKKRYNLIVKRQNEQTIDNVYSAFLNAFATALDPHSEYMAAEALEDFRIDTKLSLEGIGAVLRSDDGFTIIQSLVPGGAAAKTNLVKVDDKIISVAQGAAEPVDVIDMNLREVVKLIRGTAGTEVRLTLMREEGGKTTKLVVPVKREKVQLEDRIAKSKVFEVELKDSPADKGKPYKIGVLDLPSFYVDFEGMHQKKEAYRSSFRDVTEELVKLEKEKVDAVIVDLRSNGGGSLDESIKIAGLFFDTGPVVQVKDMDGRIQAHSDPNRGTVYGGPLLLMINRQSASASEILAGAIQDYERGLIVGDSHSFGKGTVQNLNDIGDKLGAVKITISKFYRPSGSSTQLKGVSSDIVLPSVVDELEIGEKHYDYALQWDQINASPFNRVNMVQPFLSTVKDRNAKRVASDPAFEKIRGEIKKYREGEKERYTVSLKEKSDKDAKKDPEADEEKMAYGQENKLEDDIGLQETLRIAGDYVRLLKKEQPANLVEIPVLKQVVAEVKDKPKAAKKKSK